MEIQDLHGEQELTPTRREFDLDLDLLESYSKSVGASRANADNTDPGVLRNSFVEFARQDQVSVDRFREKIIGKYEREVEENRRLRTALETLIRRCDGDEGVRADGSNIDTLAAHAALR